MRTHDAAEACAEGTRLLSAVLTRYSRLMRRVRRLDLILWTRTVGTPFYVAAEALNGKTIDDLERCRRVLRKRHSLTTGRDL